MLAEVTTASKGFLAFLGDNLHQIIANTGFANVTSGHLIMIGVGLFFLYLAISRNFEPMLLVPIGFGILVGNIPFSPGMEIGILKGHFEEARRAVDSYPFDVIIGSFHCTRNDDMYRYDFAHADGPAELEDFYTYMYECLKEFQDFDIAGHFSILDRYIGTLYDYGAVEDQIDEILKLLINNGKGLEINTSSFKYGTGTWLPRRSILSRYLNLGGEILTFGSDAHDPFYYQYHFNDAVEFARSIGFRHYCKFHQRKPEFYKLP